MRPRASVISAPRVLNLQGLTAKCTILCGSWVTKLSYSCLHSKCFTHWMISSPHLEIPKRFELSTKIYILTAPILEGKDKWKSYKGVGNKLHDFPWVEFPYNHLIFYVLHWEWRSHIMHVDKLISLGSVIFFTLVLISVALSLGPSFPDLSLCHFPPS